MTVGADWAASVELPGEDFDVELTAHGWPLDDLAIVTVQDLDLLHRRLALDGRPVACAETSPDAAVRVRTRLAGLGSQT